LTLEDPIEFIHHSQLSLIQQCEIGRDSHSFDGALRAALREDPDVILLGDARYLDHTPGAYRSENLPFGAGDTAYPQRRRLSGW